MGTCQEISTDGTTPSFVFLFPTITYFLRIILRREMICESSKDQSKHRFQKAFMQTISALRQILMSEKGATPIFSPTAELCAYCFSTYTHSPQLSFQPTHASELNCILGNVGKSANCCRSQWGTLRGNGNHNTNITPAVEHHTFLMQSEHWGDFPWIFELLHHNHNSALKQGT